MKRTVNANVRYMIRRDLATILRIERESFDHDWDENDFIACLRQRNIVSMTAEDAEERPIGYMIYELQKATLSLLNLAVAPTHRRLSVGTQMIDKLTNKLSQQRRTAITLEVRETNLDAQRFFKAMGFVATGVLRGFYADVEEDAYRMVYELGGR